MELNKKYLKYKIEMIGGFSIDYLVYGALFSFVLLIYKKIFLCPLNNISHRNPDTGIIMWKGKDEMIYDIQNWLNTPKIKQDLEFQKLMEKNDITIGELKKILNKFKYKTLFHIIKYFTSQNAKTTTQQIVDNILNTLDCACANKKLFNGNEIINPKCLENVKNSKPNELCEPLIKEEITSFDNKIVYYNYPPNNKCLKNELDKRNVKYVTDEKTINELNEQNNFINKIKNII